MRKKIFISKCKTNCVWWIKRNNPKTKQEDCRFSRGYLEKMIISHEDEITNIKFQHVKEISDIKAQHIKELADKEQNDWINHF